MVSRKTRALARPSERGEVGPSFCLGTSLNPALWCRRAPLPRAFGAVARAPMSPILNPGWPGRASIVRMSPGWPERVPSVSTFRGQSSTSPYPVMGGRGCVPPRQSSGKRSAATLGSPARCATPRGRGVLRGRDAPLRRCEPRMHLPLQQYPTQCARTVRWMAWTAWMVWMSWMAWMA